MTVLITHAARGLAALFLMAGLAVAAPPPDPMQALIARPAGSNPLDPMTALRAQSRTGDAAEGNPEHGGLPDGPGAEETYYTCVACHSTDIIKQQRVTDLRWDELWDWMIDAQGMVAPDDETKTAILTYLKTNFSSER